MEIATLVKKKFGHLFKGYEEPIYYLKDVTYPVLDFTNPHDYYQLKKVGNKHVTVPVTCLADLDPAQDVMREEGGVALLAKNIPHLQQVPWYPKHEMDMITWLIDDYAFSRIPGHQKAVPYELVMLDYFAPHIRAQFLDMDNSNQIAFVDPLWLAIQPALLEAKIFMGSDPWVMYLVSQENTDVKIERTIDFRIYDWSRRMASGEWK